MEPVFIRTTSDGRKIEVIGPNVCVDGKPVANSLVDLKVHPNREAILFTLPNAAFMAGPVVLTAEEASVVRGALAAAAPAMTDRIEITERFRAAWNKRNHEAGIE
ncbi:MAG TPA: hypothetical protein VEQ35_09430 [Beijerinckia sp.]|jgi:hypothetical protein|nr:hypothetical protein [Beijerinckia sp.]